MFIKLYKDGFYVNCIVILQAAFHYQNGGPTNGGDPMNATNVRQAQQFLDRMISVSKDRCDWMTVHRGLLLKSLMNQVISTA